MPVVAVRSSTPISVSVPSSNGMFVTSMKRSSEPDGVRKFTKSAPDRL
jgi:hypothetical protein